MKNSVKISGSQLKAIIAESVEKVLNEIGDTTPGRWMLGRLGRRQEERARGYDGGKIKDTTVQAGQYDYNNQDITRDDYGYRRAYDNGYVYQTGKSGHPGYALGRYSDSPRFDDAMGDIIRNYKGREEGDTEYFDVMAGKGTVLASKVPLNYLDSIRQVFREEGFGDVWVRPAEK